MSVRSHFRPRHKRLAVALLALLLAYVVSSLDWCPPRGGGSIAIQASETAHGTLQAGAGKAEISPPFPVAIAGYGPARPKADANQTPLFVRAVVLQVGHVRIGLVSIELLTPPPSLASSIPQALKKLGISELWTVATHTHSSMGSYEPSLPFQVGGVGIYREAAHNAIIQAVEAALVNAANSLVPVKLEFGTTTAPALVASRNAAEPQADPRVTRAVFRSHQTKIAELTIFSAHPTLFPHKSKKLSADYPGEFSQTLEQEEEGVVLFFQGTVGNARANVPTSSADTNSLVSLFAASLARAAKETPLQPIEASRLTFTRVSTPLPRADASRLLPGFLRNIGDNVLCRFAPSTAQLSLLRIGPLSLLLVPVEVTYSAGVALESESGATRVVSLADDYIGYLDSPNHVQTSSGESRLQYYSPELLDTLTAAAATAYVENERMSPSK
ncbi:neutral/alkaline non-lysosomal ceramidase N-terminal domain-containing protein [Myxococcus faecalis]|uniref:neutral/alkaline non-lysosomal ceramidase N-terminal domain-containing protein n=1 Tax=Myxococcus faecalis TaxID=3115646 RepID=UPI003CF39B3C